MTAPLWKRLLMVPRAFALGVREGHASPRDLAVGMTYDHPDTWRSRAYDRGVNLGQRIARRSGTTVV